MAVRNPAPVADLSTVSRRTIAGLKLTSDADTDHDINVTAGEARDVGNAVLIELTTEITKRIDAAFAEGDDAGGLDTGAVAAATGYGVWLIRKSADGTVDMLFSLVMDSQGTPTLPAGFDQRRLIGWVRTQESAANIHPFKHQGDYFRLTTLRPPVEIVDTTLASLVVEEMTTTIPANCLMHCYGHLNNPSGTATRMMIFIFPKDGGEDAFVSSDAAFAKVTTSGTADDLTANGFVLVDGVGKVEYTTEFVGGTPTFVIRLIGCLMLTRSNP